MRLYRASRWFLVLFGLFILLIVAYGLPAQLFAKNIVSQSFIPQSPDSPPTVIFPNNLEAGIQTWNATEIAANVPAGSVSGDVVVDTDTGLSNGVPYTVGSATIPDVNGEATSWSTTFSGVINTNTVWDQNILLTGDVTVNSGKILVIEPGVTVFFAANSDDQATGLWTDKAELQIYGTLTADGTEEAAIYFTSTAESKDMGDWGGIVIHKDSGNSSLSQCVIQFAKNGIYFLSYDTGGGVLSGTVRNCLITNNDYGVRTYGDPEYPAGGSLTIQPQILDNRIENNNYGMRLQPSNGYGSVLDETLVQNNEIIANGTGIHLVGGSWWLGSVDVYSVISNNTIRDNQQHGIFIQANGSSDGSGSDTDVQPIIENNLLGNNGTNIRLLLNPRGSDGTQILNPVIRYNTIQNAETGILIEDVQTYDTLNPTIADNVFTDISGYTINNTTGRSITAESNYWGSNTDEWDAGAQPGDVNGAVSTGNHLTSASPPVLSRLSPGTALVGDSVTLYGANFGAYEYDVFVNKTVSLETVLPGQPITYTLNFGNNGPDVAFGTIITDVVPVAVQNLTIMNSGVAITPTGTIPYAWQVGDMAVGEGGTITITAVISPDLTTETTIVNTVEITSVLDVTPANNVDTAVMQVIIPEISFSQADYTVAESAGSITVTAVLSPAQPFMDVFVDYETMAGTAVADQDYAPVSGTLTFPQGITETTMAIPILDNAIPEPDRTFSLALNNPVHAILNNSSATITILDDDIPPTESVVFLPIILNMPAEPEPDFPLFIGEAIASRPVTVSGEVFFSTTLNIPPTLSETGLFFLSSDQDQLTEIVVDDEFAILLDGEEVFVYTFSSVGHPPQSMIVEIPRSVMEPLAGQAITVVYRDVFSHAVSASAIWLQYIP